MGSSRAIGDNKAQGEWHNEDTGAKLQLRKSQFETAMRKQRLVAETGQHEGNHRAARGADDSKHDTQIRDDECNADR